MEQTEIASLREQLVKIFQEQLTEQETQRDALKVEAERVIFRINELELRKGKST